MQVLMLVVATLFLAVVLTKKTVVYRLLHARAAVLWGSFAHTWLLISAIVVLFVAVLWFFGLIWKK